MSPIRYASPRSSSSFLEQHIEGQKIAQSSGEAWADVEAQIFRRASNEKEVLVPAVAEPLLVWIISGEAIIEERELDGDWQGSTINAGSFYLTQTDSPYLMRWQAKQEHPFEVLHLYLGLDLVNQASVALGLNPARFRIRDISGAQDSLISGVLKGLTDELRGSHKPNYLFIKGLSESLTIHILRNYTDITCIDGRKHPQLPMWKLRKTLEYMDAHIAEAFNLNDLANMCGMSRFHFSRAFGNTLGQSPSRWWIARRIERAKDMLRGTDKPVIEIAADVGYNSPSHFAKVFREETGVNPRSYRNV